MSFRKVFIALFMVVIQNNYATSYNTNSFECGPYGFVCEGGQKLRLCEGTNLFGPTFRCPANSVCNEDSSDVCENSRNYIDPAISKRLRCHRNERIGDPSVPGCKGYILCIPSKNRFQGIKFQCAGDTIFNGYTRTCTSPDKYNCPLEDTTKPIIALYDNSNRRSDINIRDRPSLTKPVEGSKPIECKNYKFSVTDVRGPVRATFFCPSKPVIGDNAVRCTVFSSKFCLTLERDEDDQFNHRMGAAFRRPRM